MQINVNDVLGERTFKLKIFETIETSPKSLKIKKVIKKYEKKNYFCSQVIFSK